jgi:3-oxoacid CoA-transferase subunit B
MTEPSHSVGSFRDVAAATGWNRHQLAQRVARDVAEGWYVNLGIGMPLLIARYIPDGREVLFHSENGLLGLGGEPALDQVDLDVTNAGKQYSTLLPGASSFDSALSFGMVRGGHLDLAVLGAMEVSAGGDLANWTAPGRTPGVGGAMDLVQGARRLWVVMDQLGKDGRAKLVADCALPLTGAQVVDLVFTDRGVFVPRGRHFEVVELAPGVDPDEVRRTTGAPVVMAAAARSPRPGPAG